LRYRFARAHPVKMTDVGRYHEGRACGECLEGSSKNNDLS
jgi:hypothetical protein